LQASDSYQIVLEALGIKLDIYFFYEDGDTVWIGATGPVDGQKYK